MMRWVTFVGAALVPTALALAQGAEARPGQADLLRLQRELLQNRSEVERLFDLRLRHGLGLLLDVDEGEFRSPVTPESMEQLAREQRDQQTRTSTLLEQYDMLCTAADRRRADALAQPEGCEQELVDERAAPAAPQQPVVVPVATPQREPLPGHIHGASDSQRVAKALFQAGQALMDRATMAREQANATLAVELDAQAKQRLLLAVEDLAPLCKLENPAFGALFCQGRCRELLFRLSERYDGLSLSGSTRDYQQREQEVREPFLAIAARDVVRTGARQEVEVLGPWGMAAQSAMEHFRWMNLHAGYSPRATIEALTWPGERDL